MKNIKKLTILTEIIYSLHQCTEPKHQCSSQRCWFEHYRGWFPRKQSGGFRRNPVWWKSPSHDNLPESDRTIGLQQIPNHLTKT